jgi:hypothetical protein
MVRNSRLTGYFGMPGCRAPSQRSSRSRFPLSVFLHWHYASLSPATSPVIPTGSGYGHSQRREGANSRGGHEQKQPAGKFLAPIRSPGITRRRDPESGRQTFKETDIVNALLRLETDLARLNYHRPTGAEPAGRALATQAMRKCSASPPGTRLNPR